MFESEFIGTLYIIYSLFILHGSRLVSRFSNHEMYDYVECKSRFRKGIRVNI